MGEADQPRVPEEALRHLVDEMPCLVVLVDRDRRIRWINRLVGATLDGVVGQAAESFLPPSAAPGAVALFDEAIASGRRAEITAPAIDVAGASAGDYRVHVIPLPTRRSDDGAAFVVAFDETERRAAERDRARHEARLRAIVGGSPDFLCLVDRDHRVTFLSHEDPEGPRRDEVLQMTVEDITHPDDREVATRAVRGVFETGEPDTYVSRAAVQDGTFEVRVIPFEADEVLLIVRDVTELKETAQRLSESERRLELSARAANLSFWEWYPERDQVRTSPLIQARARLGAALGAEAFLAAVHAEDRERVRAAMGALSAGDTDSLEVEYRAGPEAAWFLGRGSVVSRDDGGRRVLGCTIDITDRRIAETERAALTAQLQHAQRLESVGQLAGGVAHDFNNLLQVLRAELSLLELKLEPDDVEELSSAQQAVDRAAELTRHLLTFARRQTQSPRAALLDEIVRRVAGLLRRVMPEDIVIDTSGASQPAPIFADVGQMDQVLTNLIVNARDAMVEGGRIAVSIEPVTREGLELYAIVVEDDGPGFSEQTLGRAAEPFFTTKGAGEGTGLGLSVVHGIAQGHDGFLEIGNRPGGSGARVVVGIPRSNAVAVPAKTPPTGLVRRRHGRVLVAEDDAGVRRVTARALTGAGFTVQVAEDGDAALTAWRERGPFDLVLLDARMPGIAGQELADRLLEQRPGLPIVFVSGYSDEVLPTDWLRATGLELLQKPYGVERLLAAVDRALAAAR